MAEVFSSEPEVPRKRAWNVFRLIGAESAVGDVNGFTIIEPIRGAQGCCLNIRFG